MRKVACKLHSSAGKFLNVVRLPLNPPHQTSLERLRSLLSTFQVLFNQFKYFFNLYFLLLACSQFVPEMRLGALYTYWVPLVSKLASFVLRLQRFGNGLLCVASSIWNGSVAFKGEDTLEPTH